MNQTDTFVLWPISRTLYLSQVESLIFGSMNPDSCWLNYELPFIVISRVQIGGESRLLRSLKVAQLCMKHRINKRQKQRIVIFVASKVEATEEELGALARTLRRNNVAVDLVNICEESNTEKLAKVSRKSIYTQFL